MRRSVYTPWYTRVSCIASHVASRMHRRHVNLCVSACAYYYRSQALLHCVLFNLSFREIRRRPICNGIR